MTSRFACWMFAASFLAACVNDVRKEPGETGTNLNVCEGSSCPEETVAVAMYYDEVPWSVGGESGSSSVSSGGSIDPDTLYIFIRNDGASCGDPFAAQPCGSNWGVTIAIPPHLQLPGVLPLSSADLISTFSATGPGSGDDCWFGGGSFIDGTLEITSIDEGQVAVTLSGTSTFDFDANGSYTVPRCQ